MREHGCQNSVAGKGIDISTIDDAANGRSRHVWQTMKLTVHSHVRSRGSSIRSSVISAIYPQYGYQ